MLTPFEEKSALAGLLDRVGLRALFFLLSILWFYRLWRSLPAALSAGCALGLMLCLALALWQQRTLRAREDALRARLGGMLALEDIALLTAGEAAVRAARLLQGVYPLDIQKRTPEGVLALFQGEKLLVRCLRAHASERVSCGDVLAAQRARIAQGADRCVLCATCAFSPQAQRLCETLEPPVRAVDADALAALAGRDAPATDEQLVALGRRRRRPFAWRQLRAVVFAPEKIRRYLLYGFYLYVLYVLTGRLYALLPALLCLCLAAISRMRGMHRGAL